MNGNTVMFTQKIGRKSSKISRERQVEVHFSETFFGVPSIQTNCTIVILDGFFRPLCQFTGQALCSPNDRFDFTTGRKLALSRAMKSKPDYKLFFGGKRLTLTRNARRQIWQKFFKVLSLPYTTEVA